MDKFIAGLFAATAAHDAISLSGCNTVEGAGKDIERAGDRVQAANCAQEDARHDAACKQ